MITLFFTFLKIVKSVNSALFIFFMISFVFMLFNKRISFFIQLNIIVFIFMFSWRFFYGLDSSRYASPLIIPIIYIISYLFFSKKKNCINIFYILVIFCIVFWIGKLLSITQINSNLKILVECHDALNRKTNNCILVTRGDDAIRIKRIDNNIVDIHTSPHNIEDTKNFISNFRTINNSVLVNFSSSDHRDFLLTYNPLERFVQCKQILSFYTSNSKNKKNYSYLIKSNGVLSRLSKGTNIENESGLLINGDLELIDDSNESFKKLKQNIANYTVYNDYDETVHTPVNAYFHNSARDTEYLPKYNCSNISPIAGKYSAHISVKKGRAFILFFQRFFNGTYNYSFFVKGEKGTKVFMIYDSYNNNSWHPVRLVDFVVPDNGIYKIECPFSIDYLKNSEYFIVGSWVENGSAILDNFSLTKQF